MKLLKIIAAVLAALAAVTAVHYTAVVLEARRYTQTEVTALLTSSVAQLRSTDLTARQLEVLLAVEDPSFYEHGGVDLTTPGAGLTTITQSLVKRLYFKRFKPGIAKIRQTLIAALALDPIIAKPDQLTLLLNTAYLGTTKTGAVIGFEAAAHAHFGKRFDQLTDDEYIALVAMLIAPRTFDPRQHPARSAERVARIKGLLSGGYRPAGLMDICYGPISDEVRAELAPLSCIGGLP